MPFVLNILFGPLRSLCDCFFIGFEKVTGSMNRVKLLEAERGWLQKIKITESRVNTKHKSQHNSIRIRHSAPGKCTIDFIRFHSIPFSHPPVYIVCYHDRIYSYYCQRCSLRPYNGILTAVRERRLPNRFSFRCFPSISRSTR